MKLSYFVLVLAFIASGCCRKSGKDALGTQSENKPLLFETSGTPYSVVFIKRTACFGKCPAYEARLFSDGKVKYYGQSNVEKRGNWEAKVSLQEINSLVQNAFDIKYFLLEDQYPDPSVKITDVPTTFTSIKCIGQNKSISNKFEGPEKLKEFENSIDSLLNRLKFESVDPTK